MANSIYFQKESSLGQKLSVHDMSPKHLKNYNLWIEWGSAGYMDRPEHIDSEKDFDTDLF